MVMMAAGKTRFLLLCALYAACQLVFYAEAWSVVRHSSAIPLKGAAFSRPASWTSLRFKKSSVDIGKALFSPPPPPVIEPPPPPPPTDDLFDEEDLTAAEEEDTDTHTDTKERSLLLEKKSHDDEPGYQRMLSLRRQALFMRALSLSAVPAGAAAGYLAVPARQSLPLRAAGAAAGSLAGFLLKRAIDGRIEEAQYEQRLLDADLEDEFLYPQPVLAAVRELEALSSPNNTTSSVNNSVNNSVSNERLVDKDLRFFEQLARRHGVEERHLIILFGHVLCEAVTQVITQAKDLTELADILDFIDRLRLMDVEVANGLLLAALKVGEQLKRGEDGCYEMYSDALLLQASMLSFLVEKTMQDTQGYLLKRIKACLCLFLEEDLQETLSLQAKTIFEETLRSVMAHPQRFEASEIDELKAFLNVSSQLSFYGEADMEKSQMDVFQSAIAKQLDASVKSSFDVEAVRREHEEKKRLREREEEEERLARAKEEDLGDEDEQEKEKEKERKKKEKSDDSDRKDAKKSDKPGAEQEEEEEDEVSKAYKRHRALHARLSLSQRDIERARTTLGLSERVATAAIEKHTVPLLKTACHELLQRVKSVPTLTESAAVTQLLQERMRSLAVSPSSARTALLSAVRGINQEFMTQIQSVYTLSEQNLAQVYKVVASYVSVHKSLSHVVSALFPDARTPIPQLPFATTVRVDLLEYRDRSEGEKERDAHTRSQSERDTESERAVVDEMFRLSPEQQRMVKRILRAPKITSLVEQLLREDALHTHAKSALQKILRDNDIEEEDWRATALEFYSRELEAIAAKRAVPSKSDTERLQRVRDFLDCDAEMVHALHVQTLGDKFVRALKESRQSSGGAVISAEYAQGLHRLRERLLLSHNDTVELLTSVLQSELPTQMEMLRDLYKSDTDPLYRLQKQRNETIAKQRREREKGTESVSVSAPLLGFTAQDERTSAQAQQQAEEERAKAPRSFMKEALLLIENIAQNYEVFGLRFLNDKSASQAQETASFTPSKLASDRSEEQVEVTDGFDELADALGEPSAKKNKQTKKNKANNNATSTAEEEAPLLPFTAAEIFPIEDLVALFKHFALSRLTESDAALRKRYAEIEPLFSSLLGLSRNATLAMKRTVAEETYSALLLHALKTKERVGEEDVQQFAIIAANLPLSQEVAAEVFEDATLSAAVKHAKSVLEGEEGEKSKLTAEDARRLRIQMSSLGLDLKQDLHFSEELMATLFALEIQRLVEEGRERDFAEVQEAYGVSPEEATALLEAICARYVRQILGIALRHARRYRESECVQVTGEILKYAPYITSTVEADGNIYNDTDVERMIAFYLANLEEERQRSGEGEVSAEEREAIAQRLRELVIFNKNYVNPELDPENLTGESEPVKENII